MIENILLAITILMGLLITSSIKSLVNGQNKIRTDILNVYVKIYENQRNTEDAIDLILEKLTHLNLDLVGSKTLTWQEVSKIKSDDFNSARKTKALLTESRRVENEWFDVLKKDLIE